MLSFTNYIVINTKLGKVKGVSINYKNKKNFLLFKGIPYAHPPIYSLRWKPPILWRSNYSEDIYDATSYKYKAYEVREMKKIMRRYINGMFNNFNFTTIKNYFSKNDESEDCLYLNILTPTTEKNNLPVLIYLTDTMFNFNNNDDKFLNQDIVDKDIIIITINYRLGIFGFYTHKELDKESKNNSSGNYGILDIICAINWIKRNIECYGGNPNNITLMGDGSGANIVLYLISNKNNEGLFQKAIINSFSLIYNIRRKSNINILIGDKLVGQGKNQILRMRKIPAIEINDKYKEYVTKNNTINYQSLFLPTIDYNVILDEPYFIFKENKQMNIPIIMGKNKCDGDFFYDCGFRSILMNPNKDIFYKDNFNKLKNKYIHLEKNSIIALKKYYDDFLFTMPMILLMNFHKKKNKVFVYIYSYERCAMNLKKKNFSKDEYTIDGVLNCCSIYFNKNEEFFHVDDITHNIIVEHFSEFIKSDMDLFTSFSLRDNAIWKEFKKNYIIYLGRTSYSKLIKKNELRLLEYRYLSKLEKYKINKEKQIINNYIKNIFDSIIRSL